VGCLRLRPCDLAELPPAVLVKNSRKEGKEAVEMAVHG
jgi:hypothetical protein